MPSSLSVADGEFVAVLGPNGAGKTTLMRAIMGLIANSGNVQLSRRRRCRAQAPDACAARGVVLVPEGRGIFAPMTVAENLELGAYLLNDARANSRAATSAVFDLFPRLQERLAQVAGSLSGGEQQMLAVGRALMAEPKSCCSTSLARAWRRGGRGNPRDARRCSTRRACRSCWSSRRRRWRCSSPAAPI